MTEPTASDSRKKAHISQPARRGSRHTPIANLLGSEASWVHKFRNIAGGERARPLVPAAHPRQLPRRTAGVARGQLALAAGERDDLLQGRAVAVGGVHGKLRDVERYPVE